MRFSLGFSLFACTLAAIALLLLAIAGPSYRLGMLSLPNAFALLRWAAYAGIAGVAVSAGAAAWAYRKRLRNGLVLAAVALVASAVAVVIPYQWQVRARSLPLIHDISTDLQNPPEFMAIVPIRADAPNTLERGEDLAEQQRSGYPELAPVTLETTPDTTFDEALRTAQELGWEIVAADKSSGLIEATDTTRWFGFKDDIVVRLTPWGTGTRVDVRSVSRVGLSDVGTNARRIRDFLSALQE